MGKRIMIVLGSPRKKGNSAKLAESVARGAKEGGAKVESFLIAAHLTHALGELGVSGGEFNMGAWYFGSSSAAAGSTLFTRLSGLQAQSA